jgi:hypothetical protein
MIAGPTAQPLANVAVGGMAATLLWTARTTVFGGDDRSVPFLLKVFLKLNAGVGLGRFAIGVLGMPTDHERKRMRHRGDGASSDVGLRIDVPSTTEPPDAGIAVGIGRFRHVEDALDFSRLTCLDGDRQTEHSLRTGLDPAAIDPRLNQPPPRTLERLNMSELMCHVPHDSSLLLCCRDSLAFCLVIGRKRHWR